MPLRAAETTTRGLRLVRQIGNLVPIKVLVELLLSLMKERRRMLNRSHPKVDRPELRLFSPAVLHQRWKCRRKIAREAWNNVSVR